MEGEVKGTPKDGATEHCHENVPLKIDIDTTVPFQFHLSIDFKPFKHMKVLKIILASLGFHHHHHKKKKQIHDCTPAATPS